MCKLANDEWRNERVSTHCECVCYLTSRDTCGQNASEAKVWRFNSSICVIVIFVAFLDESFE